MDSLNMKERKKYSGTAMLKIYFFGVVQYILTNRLKQGKGRIVLKTNESNQGCSKGVYLENGYCITTTQLPHTTAIYITNKIFCMYKM
jgi:hypothetical protein